jgi:predicted dehydrogenase
MFELGCHMIDRAVDLFGRPKKVTGILRHDGPFDDGLADNTLAVLEFDRAMAEIYVAAHQPNGNRNRTLEILGTNGSMTVRPFSPVRLHTDLKQAVGSYPAGPRTFEFASGPLPAYGEDFLEMARVMRQGAKPGFGIDHDLTVQAVLLEACGFGKEEIHK